MPYIFPFGAQLHPLVQVDRTPKKVFVLGVYASAVHANALVVVASENEVIKLYTFASNPSYTGSVVVSV